MRKYIDIKFFKGALLIASPVMLQQFITTFGQLIDNLMVGTLGTEAITAVSAANNIFFVLMLLMFGISEGASIFIAQYFGAGKAREQKHAFFIAVFSTLIITSLGLLIIVNFRESLLQNFLSNSESLALGSSFISVVSYSYIFMSLNVAIASGFRAVGLTKIPTKAGVVAILINSILNYCLISGVGVFPELGLIGAAVATVISRVVELLLLLGFLFREKVDFLPDMDAIKSLKFYEVKEFVLKTAPLAANEALWGFGWAFIIAQYSVQSEMDYAIVSIAYTIANLFFVVMSGFAVACAILIGQLLGKNEIELAKVNARKLVVLGLFVGLVITVVYFSISFFVPSLYNVEDIIKSRAGNVMRIQALFFPVYIMLAVFFFTMRAGGDSKSVLFFDGGVMFFVAMPVSLLLAYETTLPVEIRFFLVQSTDLVKLAIGFYFVRKGNWARNLTNLHD